MKVLITENQKDAVLKDLIKKEGWRFVSNIVGDDYLVNKVFNKNPIKLLNLYNDLNSIPSEEYPDEFIIYRYQPNNNIMIYDKHANNLFINFVETWGVFGREFGIKNNEIIKKIIKNWATEIYGLEVNELNWFSTWEFLEMI